MSPQNRHDKHMQKHIIKWEPNAKNMAKLKYLWFSNVCRPRIFLSLVFFFFFFVWWSKIKFCKPKIHQNSEDDPISNSDSKSTQGMWQQWNRCNRHWRIHQQNINASHMYIYIYMYSIIFYYILLYSIVFYCILLYSILIDIQK